MKIVLSIHEDIDIFKVVNSNDNRTTTTIQKIPTHMPPIEKTLHKETSTTTEFKQEKCNSSPCNSSTSTHVMNNNENELVHKIINELKPTVTRFIQENVTRSEVELPHPL